MFHSRKFLFLGMYKTFSERGKKFIATSQRIQDRPHKLLNPAKQSKQAKQTSYMSLNSFSSSSCGIF
jgi:hypothetical protein